MMRAGSHLACRPQLAPPRFLWDRLRDARRASWRSTTPASPTMPTSASRPLEKAEGSTSTRTIFVPVGGGVLGLEGEAEARAEQDDQVGLGSRALPS